MATDDFPLEHGAGDADELARLTGLIEQVRADQLLGSAADVSVLLRQRLDDAGIVVSDAAFDGLVARITA